MTFPLWSQGTIECPSDVTVEIFELDDSYESYGEPTVNHNGNYTVEHSITSVENNCEGDYALHTSIKYLASDDNDEVFAECTQVISVVRATLDDVSFPENYEIDMGVYEDLDPVNAGFPTPFTDFELYTLLNSYSDQLLYTATGLRVVRSWTVLDWCEGEAEMGTQILSIIRTTNANFSGVTVSSCDNKQVEIESITLRTDAPGFTMDYSGCNVQNGNYLTYLNCVAANNDIPEGSSFFVEIEGKDDYLNGVSTLDLVHIQRHILGIDNLDEEANLISADANNDQAITAIDLVEMRKLILGIYAELPNSPSWKFFNTTESEIFAPLGSNTDFRFEKNEFPLSQLDILAVKIGDVNCSIR